MINAKSSVWQKNYFAGSLLSLIEARFYKLPTTATMVGTKEEFGRQFMIGEKTWWIVDKKLETLRRCLLAE